MTPPPRRTATAEEHYRALLAKVDDFWERAVARQPACFACAEGCDDCCGQHLTVFGVEAAAIRAHLATLAPERHRQLALLVADAGDERCPFLEGGRCAIYDVRPLICRTHGLPVRVEEGVGCCPQNFTDTDPDDATVLDLEQLNTLLVLVDRLHAEATGEPPDRPRIPLGSLLATEV